MNLFNELVYNFDHEGWNEYDLPKLKFAEIQFLCRMLGAPKSGVKENVIVRLLAVRQVRMKISKYSLEGIDQFISDYPKDALKWMAKEAGLWRSGNKRQLAVVLLNWREKARREGQRFFDEQVRLVKAAHASNPQLFLAL